MRRGEMPPWAYGLGPRHRGFGGMGEVFFGRGQRAARGDVRAGILVLLAEGPMHGYQIIQELSSRSGGSWRPSPGSVYPTLQQLEDEGLITGQEADGRRTYQLTEAGRQEVAARPEGRAAPWEDLGAGSDPAHIELREAAMALAAAVRQVVHTGTTAQLAMTKDRLVEARRALYQILAEEPAEESGGSGS